MPHLHLFNILFNYYFPTFGVWLILVTCPVHLSGEGIWHHFTVGPVADHHAAPHQENHTGRGERPSLTPLPAPPQTLNSWLASFFLPWASYFHSSCNLNSLTISPYISSQILCFFPTICSIYRLFNPLNSVLQKLWSFIGMTLFFWVYTVC